MPVALLGHRGQVASARTLGLQPPPHPPVLRGRGLVPAQQGQSWGGSVPEGAAAVWGWQQLPELGVPWGAGGMQPPRACQDPRGEQRGTNSSADGLFPQGAPGTAHPSGSGECCGCGFCSSLCGGRGGECGQLGQNDCREMQEERASEQTLQGGEKQSSLCITACVRRDQCSVSAGQELYQLSKEKADFSVVAGEEDESTAGSSGENDGNSRSSTPHSSIKSPPSKSPAKAQKAEGKVMVLSERAWGRLALAPCPLSKV